jgi:hypothetical protein
MLPAKKQVHQMRYYSMRKVCDAKKEHRTPNKNWTLEQLTEYVSGCLKDHSDMEDRIISLRRTSAVELFRAGQGLHFINDKLKAKGAYGGWLKQHGIARSTAHEAIQLYYRAKTEANVAPLKITEAKEKFGIAKKKSSSKPAASRSRRTKSSQENKPAILPAEVQRADAILVVVKKKLEEIVSWDRTGLDQTRLDQVARGCIDLLSRFLLKSTSKKGGHHAA